MPTRYLTKNLTQTAVYWGTPVRTAKTYTYDEPIEISVRWEERSELFVEANGRESFSRAVVFLDQDVRVNGYLLLGDLDDLDSSLGVPNDNESACRIRAFSKIPNLKGTGYERTAWL